MKLHGDRGGIAGEGEGRDRRHNDDLDARVFPELNQSRSMMQ